MGGRMTLGTIKIESADREVLQEWLCASNREYDAAEKPDEYYGIEYRDTKNRLTVEVFETEYFRWPMKNEARRMYAGGKHS